MFIKYQHIERLGTAETDGILDGRVYVFPKLDGTNGSVWYDEGIRAGSRNREISIENDNFDFSKSISVQENIARLVSDYKDYIFYGEYLVPHTIRTYDDKAWKKFYIFDVYNRFTGEYLPYELYSEILSYYNIEYIAPLGIIQNPSQDDLLKFLDRNIYLIKDGAGVGEGIVIKNYGYINRYGRQTWAKIVRNEFKAKKMKEEPTEFKALETVEYKIVDEYVTETLVNKEFAKIEDWTSKQIPRLLNTVYYCLVREESWEFVKKFKNPKIDYSQLLRLTIQKIKELKPEIF